MASRATGVLASDIARCYGKLYVPDSMQFGCIADECIHCARRTAPFGDRVVLTDPPNEAPCPIRIDDGGGE